MRKHPEILVMGFSEAGMFLREGGKVGAVISIHGEREFGVECEGVRRLDLGFDDCDVVASGDVVADYQARERLRWEKENGRVMRAPRREDVERLVEIAREVADVERVLVHCGGGVSRGPAAAVVMLAAWMGAGGEAYCVETVLRGRRGVCPHEGVVRFGDEVLERGGKLVEALAAHRII